MPDKKSTDIVSTDYSGINVADLSPEELLALGGEVGFITIPGFTNVSASDLLGVPFIVTGVRYQAHTADKSREGGYRDYVTLECTAREEAALVEQLKRERIVKSGEVLTDLDQLPISPGERFIVNDGSTGIRRTLTEMFHKLGLIVVKKGSWDNADKTPYDLAVSQWVNFDKSQIWTTSDGTELPYITRRPTPDGNMVPFVLRVNRGLHASWFVNEYTGPEGAITYYL